MFFFMYRNIAFWIKFICKHHWFEKDLRKSLKLPNNNYGVLLMKHFQVYWPSETIWWRYIFWGMYGIMIFFFKQSQCTKILFFSGHAFFLIKLACLYTVLQIWQLHWLKTLKKNNSQIFNFSVQMMYVVNKVDKWKSTI